MAVVGYNDIGSVNSVKIMGQFQQFSEYLMIYTELDSHAEVGDKVYVTLSKDIGEISDNSIVLDNFISSSGGDVYSTVLQGYTVLYVDKTVNAVVIDKLFESVIGDGEDITNKTIESQYLSRVSCHNITINHASIDSTTILNGDINTLNVDGSMALYQCVMIGGTMSNTDILNKYGKNYVTLNLFSGLHRSFSSNNTDIGISNGYTYIYDTLLSNCDVEGGNITDCKITNTDHHVINDGMFTRCFYDSVNVMGGYHKDITDMSENANNNWYDGYFDCDKDTGYTFKLSVWNDGVFVNGYFGSKTKSVEWVNGTFENGVFDAYMWRNGTFNGGIFGSSGVIGNSPSTNLSGYENYMGITRRKIDGNAYDGTTDITKYEYTTWQNGTFNGGVMIRTKWLNGEVGNGVITDSTIYSMTLYDGVIMDSTIKTANVLGGNIFMRNRSVVINGSTLSNCYITRYDDSNNKSSLYSYIQSGMWYFMDGYTYLNINISNKIILTNNYLMSPTITDSADNNKYVFIARQKSITGGVYNFVSFAYQQDITTTVCNNCSFGYSSNNAVFGVARSVTVIPAPSGVTSTSSKLIMLEFDSNESTVTQFKYGGVLTDELHGFSYIPLNFTPKTVYDVYKAAIAIDSSYYNPRSFDPNSVSYGIISANTKDNITLNSQFHDNSFGDFGAFYTIGNKNTDIPEIYNVLDGTYNNCTFASNNADLKKINIMDGTYNNCTFGLQETSGEIPDGVGMIDIYGGDFNNVLISSNISKTTDIIHNIINFNGGNFNSGTFGIKHTDNTQNELYLTDSKSYYASGITLDTQPIGFDDVQGYKLADMYPLIVRKNYYSNDGIYSEQIGRLHDQEYAACFIDIWNSEGIDFNGTGGINNTQSWSIDSTEQNDTIIIPSYMVAVIQCGTAGDSIASESMDKFMKFLNKGVPSIVDIDKYSPNAVDNDYRQTYNELYDRLSNYNPCEYKGYYKDITNNRIALIFSFDAIDMVYNNVDDVDNNAFDNIFKDYNQNYKNAWSDANMGYSVRPMPTFKAQATYTIPTYDDQLVLDQSLYSIYPLPQISGTWNGWLTDEMPPPWLFDNNGKLWYPLKKEHHTKADTGYKNTGDYALYFDINDFYNIQPTKYYAIRNKANIGSNSFHFIGEKITSMTDPYIVRQIELKNNFNDYYSNTVGSTGVMNVTSNDVSVYSGGWEDYKDRPYVYGYKSISSATQSNIYLSEEYNDMVNNTSVNEILHLFAHRETYDVTSNSLTASSGIEYDGPVSVVAKNTTERIITINKNITSQYGRLLKVQTITYSITSHSPTSLTLTVSNFSNMLVNYALKSNNYIYIYHTAYSGRVWITSSSVDGSNTLTLEVTPTIGTFPAMSGTGKLYGQDEWLIKNKEYIHANRQTQPIKEVFIKVDKEAHRYEPAFNGSYDSFVLPTFSNTTPWSKGINLIANFQSNANVSDTDRYPNGTVQAKLVNTTRVVNMYECMVLYSSVIPKTQETTTKRNTYLISSIPDENYLGEVHYLVNDTTNKNAHSINVWTDPQVQTGADNHFYTSIVNSTSMGTFKKVTNLYSVFLDDYASDTDNIQSIKNTYDTFKTNLWMTARNSGGDINLNDLTDIHVAGRYFSTNTTTTNKYMKIETLLSNNVITVPATVHRKVYTSLSFPKGTIGNIIEFKDYITIDPVTHKYKLNRPVQMVNHTMYRITYIDNSYNVNFYKGSKVVIFLEDTTNMTGDIYDITKEGSYSVMYITVVQDSTRETMLLSTRKGYFFMDIGEVDAQCYDKLVPGANGFEKYPNNDGDPSKPLPSNKSAKIELMNLNKVKQTTGKSFEIHAGIMIRSSYDIINGSSVVMDSFRGGNFYSGNFYGDWYGGEWFAPTDQFMGNNFQNSLSGGDFAKATARNIDSYYNLSDIINRLIKNGEYLISPPWLYEANRGDDIIKPKITRQDELSN